MEALGRKHIYKRMRYSKTKMHGRADYLGAEYACIACMQNTLKDLIRGGRPARRFSCCRVPDASDAQD